MNDAQKQIIEGAIARYQQAAATTSLLAAHVNELTAIVAAGEMPEPELEVEEQEDADDS